MADALYDWPELYDLVCQRDPMMESHYLRHAGKAGLRTLELACGTGRLTLPLAQSGTEVTAGDLSGAMLERARQRAMALGLAVDFHQLDMRSFALGRQFDRIVIAANSLLHLTSLDDFAQFLGSVRAHLQDDGLLLFDIFVPSAALLSRPRGERQLVGDFAREGAGPVRLEETIDYDAASQISHVTWYWSSETEKDFAATPLTMRQVYPQELTALLALGGFRIAERFGGFDGETFGRTSRRQVVIATPN